MASDATRVKRIERYCLDIIAKADEAEDRYGPTGMGEWRIKREFAQRIVLVLRKP